jgi:hypothetical protein
LISLPDVPARHTTLARSLRYWVAGFLSLITLLAPGLVGSVLAVGLYLSKPAQVVIGALADNLQKPGRAMP